MSDIGFYFKLLSQRFPAMAALIMLCSCVAVVIALRLPTTYSTSATLLVEAAQISPDLVRGSVQVDANEQLEVIQQRLTTRANLIALARNNRVFSDQPGMNPDEVVAEMRDRTRIRRTSGRNKATLMVISFEGRNPQQVANVVNQYVSLVLEANSDIRTERAEGTLEFFEQEVETLSDTLDRESARILEFKNRNSDALPENLDYRLGRRSLLEERLARVGRDLEGLRVQRENIKRVFETTGAVQTEGRQAQSPELTQLLRLQSELRVALSVYSETNPKVRILRNQIDALERQTTQAQADDDAESAGTGAEATALTLSLSEIDVQISALGEEAKDIQAELDALEETIDRTPSNRIALDALERDLVNTQSLYNAAVQRLSTARMGERIEVSAKGERITVLEAADVPTLPSGPNRAGIIGLGFAAGLGLSAGLFVLLELLNHTVRRPYDITRALEITPLATIPRFESSADRRRRRMLQLITLVLVLLAVPAVLWAIDTYYMPLDQLFDKIVNRLT